MIDKTMFLEIAIVVMTLSGLGIYLAEKYKGFKKKRMEEKVRFNNLEKDVKDRCYTVTQLQKEILEARKERATILSRNNNTYNELSSKIVGLSDRIQTLEIKNRPETKILGGAALSQEDVAALIGNVGELCDKT